MQTESNIQSALNKLKAAQRCHPNAVQTLIEEAIEFLEIPSPRITEQDLLAAIESYSYWEEFESHRDGSAEQWLREESGRALLNKLNDKPESVGG